MTNEIKRPVLGKDELLIQLFRELFPDLEKEMSAMGKSLVDVGVWLVGLSTGVLAILLSSSTASGTLHPLAFKLGVISFSLVILLGVLQRIIFHVAELKKWPLSVRLRAALIALSDDKPMASELQDHWTVKDIVKRLEDDFGVDYGFLAEGIHREFEKKGLNVLAQIICTHTGLSKDKEDSFFQPTSEGDSETIRSQAIFVNWIYRASDISYYVAAFMFVSGIGVLAWGAI